MEYSKIEGKNNIYIAKTKDFKTTKIEAIYRIKADKKHLTSLTFLTFLLNDSSKKYNSRRKVAIKLEDLYKTFYSVNSIKLGSTHNLIFSLDFINSEFIKEKNYINDIVSFLYEMIYNPNIINNKFDEKSFNIIKNDMLLDIDANEEISERKAINRALKIMDNDSISSFDTYGTREDINKITRESLVKEYKYFLDNSSLDFFICGNDDAKVIAEAINNVFNNTNNLIQEFDYFVDNKESKPREIEEKDVFPQSELVILYNIKDLSKKEREIVFPVMNYILGSGGLTSKLYKYIREENSYCYHIGSMYFRYDNLLCISSSMERKNVNNTLNLVNKAISEMQKGIFSLEDISNAKKNMILSLEVNENNQRVILNNYEFKTFLDIYTPEEKKILIENVSKKEIIDVANKLKENLVYILCEAENEEN